MDAPGSTGQPDGDVFYRTDTVGERVGVFPATCRHGEHSLHAVGYRAYDNGTGFLHVSCNACFHASPPRYDHYWVLRLTGPTPLRAELDDEPYSTIFATRQLSS